MWSGLLRTHSALSTCWVGSRVVWSTQNTLGTINMLGGFSCGLVYSEHTRHYQHAGWVLVWSGLLRTHSALSTCWVGSRLVWSTQNTLGTINMLGGFSCGLVGLGGYSGVHCVIHVLLSLYCIERYQRIFV